MAQATVVSNKAAEAKKQPMSLLNLPGDEEVDHRSNPYFGAELPLLVRGATPQWPIKNVTRSSRKYYGLTQVCKQLRKEYLPIWRGKEVVMISWDEVSEFAYAFYPAKQGLDGPKVLQVLWTQNEQRITKLLPLINFRMSHPGTTVRIHINRSTAWLPLPRGLGYPQMLYLHRLNCILNHDNTLWEDEIRRGFIMRVDVRDSRMQVNGETIVEIELSRQSACRTPFLTEDQVEEIIHLSHERWFRDITSSSDNIPTAFFPWYNFCKRIGLLGPLVWNGAKVMVWGHLIPY